MRIAISTDGTQVSPHFGRCPAFTLVDVESGRLVARDRPVAPRRDRRPVHVVPRGEDVRRVAERPARLQRADVRLDNLRVLRELLLDPPDPGASQGPRRAGPFREDHTMNDGTNWALVAVNLIIWSGIFLYLLRLQRQLDRTENDS